MTCMQLLLELATYENLQLTIKYKAEIIYGGLYEISSVSIVSDYGLDNQNSIPDRGKDFSSSPCVQTGSGSHLAFFYPAGTGGPFPGGKAQPGRDADHSPPSSAEVKNQ
jgi:hypothetical protein